MTGSRSCNISFPGRFGNRLWKADKSCPKPPPMSTRRGEEGSVELKRDSVGKKSNHSSPLPMRVRAIMRLKASCSSGMDFNQSKYVPLKLKANWKGPEVM